MDQISIFDGSQRFVVNKPIRLIELFAGYGSQSLALKYLGMPFEHWRISEWAIKSIQAYKDLHATDDSTDYSQSKTVKEIRSWLNGRISSDYNTPLSEEKIKWLPEKQVRTIYNNMQATRNVGSITQISAKDLAVVDTDKYCYIMTYSFPCQDLSQSGQGKGMSKGSGTRSGLLWEVERLLEEMTERPQVLLMENVPQVVGKMGIKDFALWLARLEEFGYKNYWQCLNAKGYGIPQNRNRCFMVSLLGDYRFTFPKPQNLTVRLKDFLNKKEVDEKYYLSDKTIKMFIEHTRKQQEKGNGFKFEPTNGGGYAKSVLTRPGERPCDNFIIEQGNARSTKRERVCDSLDGERLQRLWQSSNERSSGMEEIKCERVGMLGGGKWDKLHDQNRRVYGVNGLAPTMLTCGGGEFGTKEIEPHYRIRKLTERECFRLQGVKDEDFEKVAKKQSTSSLYHLAGDSIVTTVLMAIFGELFGISDYNEKIDNLVKELKEDK